MDTYKHGGLTQQIIGCAMSVHRSLGNGFPEVIYQRSLAIELRDCGLSFERELDLPVYYKEQQVGSRRVDFLVDACVLVELKAVSELTAVHYAQVLNYLSAYRLEVALLINFGLPSLDFRRVARRP